MEDVLNKIYYDAGNPGSLGGVDRLVAAVKTTTGGAPKIGTVKKWLEKQDVYTLHAPAAKRFQRNRVYANGIDKQFQADLVEMGEYSEDNEGTRYLLTCIDIFSKYAWVRPLRSKTGASVTDAFKDILSDGRIPKLLQTDAGTEFYNKSFQKLITDHGIKHFSTHNDTKACIVERFNRTLKTRMWRYLTAANSKKYLTILPQLIISYNNSRHRSIKMAPADVNKHNEHIVFNNLYKNKKEAPIPFKYTVGDHVRISKYRGIFSKGYEQSFSEEYFIITECVARMPPVYRLKDIANEAILGTFYEKELQKVTIEDHKAFKIEKILKKKKQRGVPLALVKWQGWGEKFNSWVPISQINDQ